MSALSFEEYPLHSRVFDLLNETPIEDADLWHVSPEALAEFLTQFAGGVLDGEPDVLHGVPVAAMVGPCTEWLAETRADRLDDAETDGAAQ